MKFKLPKIEFSKLIVIWLIFHGTVWTYLSYGLAWKGKEDIAEDLSEKVVIELLGGLGIYAAKALFENLSKNNMWPDKPTSKNENRDC